MADSEVIIGYDAEGGDIRLSVHSLMKSRAAILGNSGSGKSWLLRLILETVGAEIPFVLIDPDGEFASLRELHTQVLLIGEDGDVPVPASKGELVGRQLRAAGASAVVDLQSYEGEDQQRFVAGLLSGIFSASREHKAALLIAVDEVQTICPQQPVGAQVESAKALNNIMQRGRKRGLCGVIATQRPAQVDKQTLSQASNFFFGRMNLPADRQLAAAYAGLTASGAKRFAELHPGEFLCFGPSISGGSGEDLEFLEVAAVQTTHEHGDRVVLKAPESIGKLATAIAKAIAADKKADTPADTAADTSPEHGMAIAALQRDLSRARADNEQYHAEIEHVRAGFAAFQEKLLRKMLEAMEMPREVIESATLRYADNGFPHLQSHTKAVLAAKAEKCGPAPTPAPPPPPPATGARAELKQAERDVLDALAWLASSMVPSATRETVAALTNRSPKSSAFGGTIAELMRRGMVESPAPGLVRIKHSAMPLAHFPKAILTNEELHARWLQSKALKGNQPAILEQLIAIYPDAITREELATMVGQSVTSSAFGGHLSALKELGLIEYPQTGAVCATRLLFPM